MLLKPLTAGAVLGALAALASWSFDRTPTVAEDAAVQPRNIEAARRAPSELVSATSDASARSAAPPRSDEGRDLDSGMGILAFGFVTDADGAPLDGASVLLEDEEARQTRLSTSTNGGWSKLGLAPGSLDLAVSLDGFLPLEESLVVPAASRWRHDVVLERALVLPVRFEDERGVAYELGDGGQLARFLGVAATSERPGARIEMRSRSMTRSEAGSFRSRAERGVPADLGPRYQGRLTLKERPPLWVCAMYRDRVLEARRLSGAETELVFVVPEGLFESSASSVRVRVVDAETGERIDAAVRLRHPTGGTPIAARIEGDVFVFDDVPPGSMELETGWQPYERLEREVHVEPGQIVDIGTIELAKSQPFEVRLVDDEGNCVWGYVYAARSGSDQAPSQSSQTGANGVAPIYWLAPGPTWLRISGRDGFGSISRLVDTREATSFEFVVPRGAKAVFPDLRPVDGRSYLLEDSEGRALFSGPWMSRSMTLAPGRHSLTVFDGGVETARVAFEMGVERTVVRTEAD